MVLSPVTEKISFVFRNWNTGCVTVWWLRVWIPPTRCTNWNFDRSFGAIVAANFGSQHNTIQSVGLHGIRIKNVRESVQLRGFFCADTSADDPTAKRKFRAFGCAAKLVQKL